MADYMGMDTSLIAAQRDAAFGQLAESDSAVSRLARKGAMGVSVLMFGYMNGRYQNPKLMGAVPADLASAVGLTVGHMALDYFMPGAVPAWGAMAVDALADGALASYLSKLGTGFGFEAAVDAKEPWALAMKTGTSTPSTPSTPSSTPSSSGYEGTYGTLPGSIGALSASEAEIYVR